MGVLSSSKRAAYESGEYNPAICPLLPSQLQMVRMLADGKLRKTIAEHFGVSEVTIHHHLREACDRAGVIRKDFALVAKAIRQGWIE